MPSLSPARLLSSAQGFAWKAVHMADLCRHLAHPFGWDWYLTSPDNMAAERHPKGHRWGWYRHPSADGKPGNWSLTIWAGPLHVILDRDLSLTAKGKAAEWAERAAARDAEGSVAA